MRDFTKGDVGTHVLQLSAFIALTTFFQTLYLVVDMYFVGRLGKEAVAGVALSGNLMMIVLALTQALGVGATSLIAQALGRRDRDRAEIVFNQTLVVSTIVAFGFAVLTFLLRGAYSRWLAADPVTAARSVEYLNWFIPAMSLQFLLVGMGAALRGSGDMKMPTAIQVATVLANMVLAPLFMFPLGMGVAGAACASFVAILFGLVAFVVYFERPASLLKFRRSDWKPQPRLWGEMLKVGLPVGGEFGLISVYMMLVYSVLRPFGAAAQAGFGIGVRIMQSLFLPSVAIGFATAPIAGQNFGARQGDRVRQTFAAAAKMSAAVMTLGTLVCHIAPAAMIAFFNPDPAVVGFGTEYLRIVSWMFVASGMIFVSSSVFQGMGNTLPALGSSALRLLLFALPVLVLSHQAGFQIRHVWYLSIVTTLIQMSVSLWLLRREFARRLNFESMVHPVPSV
jgi:putative MATE family efflux protein